MKVSRFGTIVFLVVFLASLLLVGQVFWPFLTPIILALVFVSLFHRMHERVLSWCKGRKVISATIITLGIVVCVAVPIAFFGIALSNQALELYQSALDADILSKFHDLFSKPNPIADKIRQFAPILGIDEPFDNLLEAVGTITRSIGLTIYSNITSIASNLVIIVFHFFICVVIIFTLFIAGPTLKDYLMDLSPLPLDEKERLVSRFREVSRAVFIGNGATSVVEGILGGLGFYLFDVGPGILWGAIIALAAFLPVVGASVVFIPATIILLVGGYYGLALGFLIYNVVYAFILEGLIKPRLIGGRSRMHAVLVFLAVMGGIQVYGPLGLFYGPLIVTMFMTLVQIFNDHYKTELVSVKDLG